MSLLSVSIQGENLHWTNDSDWHGIQNNRDDTNIVSSKLYHDSGIRISILDLVHPEVPVIVRRVKVQSQKKITVKFSYYPNFNVGRTLTKIQAFVIRISPDRTVSAKLLYQNSIIVKNYMQS